MEGGEQQPTLRVTGEPQPSNLATLSALMAEGVNVRMRPTGDSGIRRDAPLCGFRSLAASLDAAEGGAASGARETGEGGSSSRLRPPSWASSRSRAPEEARKQAQGRLLEPIMEQRQQGPERNGYTLHRSGSAGSSERAPRRQQQQQQASAGGNGRIRASLVDLSPGAATSSQARGHLVSRQQQQSGPVHQRPQQQAPPTNGTMHPSGLPAPAAAPSADTRVGMLLQPSPAEAGSAATATAKHGEANGSVGRAAADSLPADLLEQLFPALRAATIQVLLLHAHVSLSTLEVYGSSILQGCCSHSCSLQAPGWLVTVSGICAGPSQSQGSRAGRRAARGLRARQQRHEQGRGRPVTGAGVRQSAADAGQPALPHHQGARWQGEGTAPARATHCSADSGFSPA